MQGIDTAGKDGGDKGSLQIHQPAGRPRVRLRPADRGGAGARLSLALHQRTPRKGYIDVFNRSHYEDVLVVKVRKLAPAEQVEQRYEQINQFEKHLVENGTRVLKLMLHISKEEQGERLKERLEVPEKRWKFNPSDLEDRKLWDHYQKAYRDDAAALLDALGAVACRAGRQPLAARCDCSAPDSRRTGGHEAELPRSGLSAGAVRNRLSRQFN